MTHRKSKHTQNYRLEIADSIPRKPNGMHNTRYYNTKAEAQEAYLQQVIKTMYGSTNTKWVILSKYNKRTDIYNTIAEIRRY